MRESIAEMASRSPIIYPAAVIAGAKDPAAAAFLAFLNSPAAVKIPEDQGFRVLQTAVIDRRVSFITMFTGMEFPLSNAIAADDSCVVRGVV